MRKIVFLWMALFATALCSYADDKVTFTASAAPDVVAVGDQLRLSYTVNTQKVKDFRVPSIKGFDVLMGPSRSYSRQNFNGNVTENLTYTYILLAKAEGEYTIPGATLSVGKDQYLSNSVKIKVLPADQSSNAQGAGSGQGGRRSSSSSGTSSSNNALFITATLSNTNVSDTEAILILPNGRRWGLEHYKGRNYHSTI